MMSFSILKPANLSSILRVGILIELIGILNSFSSLGISPVAANISENIDSNDLL